ncbi:MAG TPA: SPOR domain-containing protein [Terriglobales bacterium]|nr:SPOR domain-containing protein [Terriglobales bacterium]
MELQDTEITLGTGKMLGLFFGLVALCAAFFGVGFSLGRKSAAASLIPPDQSRQSPVSRPGAVKSSPPSSAATQPSDLTFYKAVEQKGPSPQLAAAATPAAPKSSPDSSDDKSAAPDPAIALAQGYFVQVAAVTKQEDAQALVEALKKKQYAAFASNSAPDKLFHVQIGPFNDVKDAELTRAKLISDGYNPILKK